MSEIKKRLQLLSVFACCVLLCGCSADETSSVSSVAAKKTDLSVSWWGDDVRNEYMLQTLGSFAQQYPDIHLSMNYTTSEAYPALCAARNAASMDCDVIQISYEQFCCTDPAKSFYSLSSIKDYLNLHLQSSESLSWGTSGDTLYALQTASICRLSIIMKNSFSTWMSVSLLHGRICLCLRTPVPEKMKNGQRQIPALSIRLP